MRIKWVSDAYQTSFSEYQSDTHWVSENAGGAIAPHAIFEYQMRIRR